MDSSGIVVAIVDGDTYDISIGENQTLRVRMAAIDAPERGMPFYKVAKQYLATLCFQKKVHLRIVGKDRNSRVIAYSELENGVNLNLEMIKNGMAWHYKEYSSDPALDKLEAIARLHKTGLWADEKPVAPWDFRKQRKSKRTLMLFTSF